MGNHWSCTYSPESDDCPWNVEAVRDGQYLGRGKFFIQEDDMFLRYGSSKNETVVHWPIRSIRRYGCDDGCFSFESGRRCSTGAAKFVLKAKFAQRMFTCLQDRVNIIQEADKQARLSDTSSCARPPLEEKQAVVTNSYQNWPVNGYVNCDLNGHYNGPLREEVDRHRRSLVPSTTVEYAELELLKAGGDGDGVNRKSQIDGKIWRLPGFPDSPETSPVSSKSPGTGSSANAVPVDGISYVQIDSVKTKAVRKQNE